MKVYGVSAWDIEDVVCQVSRENYDGNVILKSLSDCSNSRGPRSTFTLRVRDSQAGRRGAIGNPNSTGTGPNGLRRRIGACWHAHWDVIEKLFERFPEARLTSGFRMRGVQVEYTAATFKDVARDTAHLNVGTVFAPATMPECCECDHSLYCEDEASVNLELSQQPERFSTPRPEHDLSRSIRYLGESPSPDGYVFWGGGGDGSGATLGDVPAAQPFTPRRRTADETLAEIDKVLAGDR